LERFHFYIEELDHQVDIFVLSPDECHAFMARFSHTAAATPTTSFQRFVLDGLIDGFSKKVWPMIEEIEDEYMIDQVSESLLSMCLTANPLISVLAYAISAQSEGLAGVERLRDEDGSLPGLNYDDEEQPEPEGERVSWRALSPELVRDLAPRLEEAVVGQGVPIREVSRSFRRAAAGLRDPERPLCSFILAGCSGVGKTLLVKELNRCLYEDQPLIRIDCSEFQQEHEYAKLIGCFPPGSQVSMPGGYQCDIEYIPVGSEVISEEGSTQEVLENYTYEYTGDLVTFCTRMDTRATMCTPSHNVCVWDGAGFEWKEAAELKEGDWLLFPHGQPGPGAILPAGVIDSCELWELLGWYLSRGKRDHGTLHFAFYDHEMSAQGRLLRLTTSCFQVEEAYMTLEEENTPRLNIISPQLGDFLGEVLNEEQERFLDVSLAESMSREQIIHLLLGFFGICEETLGETKDFTAATRSATHLSQIRLLAARAGYLPMAGMLPTNMGETIYRMALAWPDLWDLVREMHGQKRVKNQNPYYRRLKEGMAICVSRVNRVYYSGQVYDISVQEGVSYLVNQLLVHNSPPGYKDSENDGYLTGRLKECPQSIVLVDEIDKASPRLFDLFLQILGEGFITDNHGQLVDCTQAAFFFTTNLGNEYAVKGTLGFTAGDDVKTTHKSYVEYVTGKLQRGFRLELLGRMDDVLVFSRLSPDDYLRIVDLEMEKIRERLRASHDLDIYLRKSARMAVAARGASDKYGARGIAGVLREEIEDVVADHIIENSPEGMIFVFGWNPKNGFELELRDKRRKRR